MNPSHLIKGHTYLYDRLRGDKVVTYICQTINGYVFRYGETDIYLSHSAVRQDIKPIK